MFGNIWSFRIFPLGNKNGLSQICSNSFGRNKLNDEFAQRSGKTGVILYLEVWKWQFSRPLSRAVQIPPVWGGVTELRNIPPNGHLLLHSWMDSQFADGLRVFPINNTFLSHAISTPSLTGSNYHSRFLATTFSS